MSASFQSASFLTSAATLAQCPADSGAEVAFCGRSNAGKSSAINALTRQKSLVRTSKTPGRTRLINFFALGPGRRLVDLPGYGYAKVPRAVRDGWRRHLDAYLRNRRCLRGLVLLTDIRHPMQAFDLMLIDWSHACGLPVHVLLTKADKLKHGRQQSTLASVTQSLAAPATVQVFSATQRIGIGILEQKVEGWLAEIE